MSIEIQSRIFLVGCPRSGTTLLQSLISAHPQIASFPESKFFNALVSPGSRRSRLNLPTVKARKTFDDFLEEVGCSDMKKTLSKTAFLVPEYANAFVRVLDLLAQKQAKTCWIEKTPSHVQRINCIEKLVSEAKFVHIVREGEDVVASLYEVTRKYPEVWKGARSIDQCLRRWSNDVQISLHHQHRDNHFLVRYEDLVEDTEAVLMEICSFCGVQFYESMLKDYAANSDQIVRSREKWKMSVSRSIENKKRKKFTKLFDEEDQKYIVEQVAKVNVVAEAREYKRRFKTDCCLV